jgi:hypothetical protein
MPNAAAPPATAMAAMISRRVCDGGSVIDIEFRSLRLVIAHLLAAI